MGHLLYISLSLGDMANCHFLLCKNSSSNAYGAWPPIMAEHIVCSITPVFCFGVVCIFCFCCAFFAYIAQIIVCYDCLHAELNCVVWGILNRTLLLSIFRGMVFLFAVLITVALSRQLYCQRA